MFLQRVAPRLRLHRGCLTPLALAAWATVGLATLLCWLVGPLGEAAKEEGGPVGTLAGLGGSLFGRFLEPFFGNVG